MPSAYHTLPARSRVARACPSGSDGGIAGRKNRRNRTKALLMIAALLPVLSGCGSGPGAVVAPSSNDRLKWTGSQTNPEGEGPINGGGWFDPAIRGGAVADEPRAALVARDVL